MRNTILKISNGISEFMEFLRLPILALALIMTSLNLVAQDSSVRGILESFANDYREDLSLDKDITFGIKIDDSFYHIIAKAKSDDAAAFVSLQEGLPDHPVFYFTASSETLNNIVSGKWNPLTAAVAAFSNEKVPLDVDMTEGFQPDKNFMEDLLSVYFHFWTKGTPEIIPFGNDQTRFTHGADATVFYYQPGFRSAFVSLKKGHHANKDERSRTNPFPSLIIAISGQGVARINGEDLPFGKGQAMLIPKNVSHELMNPENDEALECILIMFGEGA